MSCWLGDRVISDLGLRLLSGDGTNADGTSYPRIEFPELFEVEEPEKVVEEAIEDTAESRRRVLMIARGAPFKNFLPPVFVREGVDLAVVSDAEEAREKMAEGSVEAVLLAGDMEEEFSGLGETGRLPRARCGRHGVPFGEREPAGKPCGLREAWSGV